MLFQKLEDICIVVDLVRKIGESVLYRLNGFGEKRAKLFVFIGKKDLGNLHLPIKNEGTLYNLLSTKEVIFVKKYSSQ